MDTPIIIILVTVIAFLIGVFVFYMVRTILLPKQIGNIEKLVKNQQYAQAMRAIKPMLAKKGGAQQTTARLHYLQAQCHRGTKNYALAIVEYRAAMKGAKTESLKFEVQIRRELAETLMEMGKVQEALQEFILITKLSPNTFDTYYQIGKIYQENNSLDNAIKYLTKALELNHEHAPSYYYLGLAKYRVNKEGEAHELLVRALQLDPKRLDVHYYLGKMYRNAKDYMKALEEFEVSIRDKEFKRQSFLERGVCFIEMGNTMKAIVELENGLKLPQSGDAVTLALRYALAKCYEENRELTDALDQWEKISKVKADYKDVPDKLAAYADLRHDDVLKDFLTATSTVYEETSCKMVAAMNLKVMEVHHNKNGDIVILSQEITDDKWKASKMTSRYVQVRRETELKVSENDIRNLLEYAKKNNVTRAIFVTASKFSEQAVHYADTRPIDLIDGAGLQDLLKKAQKIEKVSGPVNQAVDSAS